MKKFLAIFVLIFSAFAFSGKALDQVTPHAITFWQSSTPASKLVLANMNPLVPNLQSLLISLGSVSASLTALNTAGLNPPMTSSGILINDINTDAAAVNPAFATPTALSPNLGGAITSVQARIGGLVADLFDGAGAVLKLLEPTAASLTVAANDCINDIDSSSLPGLPGTTGNVIGDLGLLQAGLLNPPGTTDLGAAIATVKKSIDPTVTVTDVQTAVANVQTKLGVGPDLLTGAGTLLTQIDSSSLPTTPGTTGNIKGDLAFVQSALLNPPAVATDIGLAINELKALIDPTVATTRMEQAIINVQTLLGQDVTNNLLGESNFLLNLLNTQFNVTINGITVAGPSTAPSIRAWLALFGL